MSCILTIKTLQWENKCAANTHTHNTCILTTFYSNTPPQVGEWMSCTPNLCIIGIKKSLPKGFVKTSASWCAELTYFVAIEPS